MVNCAGSIEQREMDEARLMKYTEAESPDSNNNPVNTGCNERRLELFVLHNPVRSTT